MSIARVEGNGSFLKPLVDHISRGTVRRPWGPSRWFCRSGWEGPLPSEHIIPWAGCQSATQQMNARTYCWETQAPDLALCFLTGVKESLWRRPRQGPGLHLTKKCPHSPLQWIPEGDVAISRVPSRTLACWSHPQGPTRQGFENEPETLSWPSGARTSDRA